MTTERKTVAEWARDPLFVGEFKDKIRSLVVGPPPSWTEALLDAVGGYFVKLALEAGEHQMRADKLEADLAAYIPLVEATEAYFTAVDAESEALDEDGRTDSNKVWRLTIAKIAAFDALRAALVQVPGQQQQADTGGG